MSDQCQICGPNKSEAPIVICAPCALTDLGRQKEAALSAELLYLRIMRDELAALRGDYPREVRPEYRALFARLDRILAIGKTATGPAVATPSCPKCGAPMLEVVTESGECCLVGCE